MCSVVSDSFVTLGSAAHQAPLSMGFPRQEYWSGLPYPPPEDLPNPRIEPESFVSPALADEFFTPATPGEPQKKRRRKLKLSWGHFPGGPVAKTPCFQCRGSGFDLWLEN